MQPKSLVSNTQESNIQGKMVRHTSVINVPSEKWSLQVETMQPDFVHPREECLLSIKLPNGKTLSGTIQQFQSLEAIIYNAANHMKDFAGIPMTDKQEESNILDSCSELAHALSMFKK